MATVPQDNQNAHRDRPLVAIGIIMAILLATLVALPFLARIRHHSSRQAISTTVPGTSIPASTTGDRHF